jgi:hypothetical protein
MGEEVIKPSPVLSKKLDMAEMMVLAMSVATDCSLVDSLDSSL